MLAVILLLSICPETYPECPSPRYLESTYTLGYLGAPNVSNGELGALSAITRDGRSKGWFDVVRTDCGAHGLVHRRPRDGWDGYGQGYHTDNPCPVEDESWVDAVQAWLYWDYTSQDGAGTVAAWRSSVAFARIPDRCKRRVWCEAVALAIANSSPTLARTLGQKHNWRPDRMLAGYIHDRPTDHRRRRADYLRRWRTEWTR